MSLSEAQKQYIRDVREELEQLIRDLCAIPAPSLHEEKRAAFCRDWFVRNGFENVTVDEACNVLAPVSVTEDNPLFVVMAHTDTVFPDMEKLPFSEDEKFMYSPGVTDDTANLAVLMICARYYLQNHPSRDHGVLFVANSSEEGLGNLKGCRCIMARYGHRVRQFLTADGLYPARMVTRAVGSHRYRIRVSTEGGHSFANFGNRNAIAVLASLTTLLYSMKVPQEGNSRTTYNVGTVSGGTSVNTIAQDAEMTFEYRSDSRNCLAKMKRFLENAVETFRASGAEISVELIGDRPCSGEVDPGVFDLLKNKVRSAIGDIVGEEAVEAASSTDCNIPLSQGIPAVCISCCRGSGAHTRSEKLEKASLAEGCSLLLDILFRD